MQAVTIDRDKYIGGSDIPIIMGISPFKTRFDLLLEKAGIKENDFTGNEYTEYGNVLEPQIRDYINKKYNLGFEEYKKINGDIRVHLDGFNNASVLEIKTTSQIHNSIDEYKVYLVQLLFYMQEVNADFGRLAVYERPDDFNEEFDENRLTQYTICITDYKELLDQINKAVEQFRIDLEKVKANPFITEEELMPIDLTELSNKIVAIETRLAEYKALEQEQKELKAQLKSAMENNGVKSWETPNGVKITLVLDTPDKEVEEEYYNEEQFIADNLELHEAYHNKLAEYKDTRIVIKKGKVGYVKITLPKEK